MAALDHILGGSRIAFAPNDGAGSAPASGGGDAGAGAASSGGDAGSAAAPSGGSDPGTMDFAAPAPAPAEPAPTPAEPAAAPAAETVEILDELSDQANQPPRPETPEEPAKPAEKILGRFENQDELIDHWKQLNDIVRGRTSNLPDEALMDQLQERGLLEAPPDGYDFNAGLGENPEVVWKSRDDAPDAYAQITGQLRDARITQAQLNSIMPIVSSIVNEAVRDFGAQVDVGAEKNKLTQEWGSQTDTRGSAVRQWVEANFHSHIFHKPLGATAEGIKFLYSLMANDRGAQPVVPDATDLRPAQDPLALESELKELRRSEGYRDSNHRDHTRIHERYRELLEQKLSLPT